MICSMLNSLNDLKSISITDDKVYEKNRIINYEAFEKSLDVT